MYTKYVFETAKEFFRACKPTGAYAIVDADESVEDVKPTVPETVYVVFRGTHEVLLDGSGSNFFEFASTVSQGEMISTAFEMLHSRVQFDD